MAKNKLKNKKKRVKKSLLSAHLLIKVYRLEKSLRRNLRKLAGVSPSIKDRNWQNRLIFNLRVLNDFLMSRIALIAEDSKNDTVLMYSINIHNFCGKR